MGALFSFLPSWLSHERIHTHTHIYTHTHINIHARTHLQRRFEAAEFLKESQLKAACAEVERRLAFAGLVLERRCCGNPLEAGEVLRQYVALHACACPDARDPAPEWRRAQTSQCLGAALAEEGGEARKRMRAEAPPFVAWEVVDGADRPQP